MDIIDPHIHLFALEQGQYGWLQPQNPPDWPNKQKISLDYRETDLVLHSPLTLKGFVHIEAGFDNQQPWREVAWLEQNCTAGFRSIAFSDITDEHFLTQLELLSHYPSVAGIRHILEQDAVDILSHGNTLTNLRHLAERGWVFEAQLFLNDRQGVALLHNIMQQLPPLKVVINHAGFGYQSANFSTWFDSLTTLAKHPNCFIKCSGWEMADWQWQPESIETCINTILQVFGEDKVMLASNFPVSELSLAYSSLWQRYQALIADPALFRKLACENAESCYQLDPEQKTGD